MSDTFIEPVSMLYEVPHDDPAIEPGMRTLLLREYGNVEADTLTESEIHTLLNSFDKYIGVKIDPRTRRYSLEAKNYVGVIQLGNLRIRIVPKTPAANLFYMFTYAWSLDIQWNELSELQAADDVFEFIVTLFSQQVEELVREGIFRAYRTQEESLPYLRGRLNLAAQIRREITAPGVLAQEIHEYTPDVLHNRILLFALHRLARLPWRNPLLGQRIRRVEQVFAEVSLTPVEDADFEGLVYSRLNESYQSRHRLARLLLQMHSIEGSDGIHHFNAWLLDMDTLFELFVAHFLQEFVERESHLRTRFSVELQEKFRLGHLLDDMAKPDIVIKERQAPRLVLDTKNKVLDGRPKDEDRRQMREYANILGLEDGWLIYSGGVATHERREYSGRLPFTLHTLIWTLDGTLEEFRARSMENASLLLRKAQEAGVVASAE